MRWEPSFIKQWTCIGCHFVRISSTPLNRINKRIALWAHSKASPNCRNWFYSIKECPLKLHLRTDYDINRPLGTEFVNNHQEAGLNEFKTSWLNSIQSLVGPSGRGRNKLRTYCLFKSIFETEPYCTHITPFRHRAAFTKFGCGVAPLRIETGRYENKPLEERKCPFYDEVESEIHVIFNCNLYDDFRAELFSKAVILNPDFNNFTLDAELIFLFSNHFMIRSSAKTCFKILQRRAFYMSK